MSLPTPAIVAQSAVRRIPRSILLVLCGVYILAGFVGRAPWREVDMQAFALMRALAQGQTHWLHPQLGPLLPSDPGLLQYWLGAWAIQWLPASWSSDWVARLPFMGLLALALACTWRAVYGLARMPSAQPVSFAFGGEAHPKDYACALADGALLALLACLGLAQMGHETSHRLVQLAALAALFYAASNLRWQPLRAGFAAFLAPQALALAGAPELAMALVGLVIVGLAGIQTPKLPQRFTWMAWWALALVCTFTLSKQLNLWHWSAPLQRDWASLARLLTWFSWPAWPLALWTLWRWRRQLAQPLQQPHLTIPLGLWIATLAAMVLNEDRDGALLLTLPAIAAVAAFALPTLRRSLGALIDWLTLIFFTVSALTIWVVWLSVQTGWPAKPAANVARLSDGYQPPFEPFTLAMALVATAAWLLLVAWRTRRHRAAIWKSLALPAGGTVLGWVLLMTLWLPMLDYGRSYAPHIARLQNTLPAQPGCVQTWGLSIAQVGALRWHTDWSIVPTASAAAQCDWLITATPDEWQASSNAYAAQWLPVRNVLRPTNRDDQWLVLQRRNP